MFTAILQVDAAGGERAVPQDQARRGRVGRPGPGARPLICSRHLGSLLAGQVRRLKGQESIGGLLRFGSGFGLGYVLGTRAGRQRYEQLLSDGKRLLQHPKVQEVRSRLPAVVQQRLPAQGLEHSASGDTAAWPLVPVGSDGVTGPAEDQTQAPPPPPAAEPPAAEFFEPIAAQLPPGPAAAVPPEQEGLSSNRPLIDPVVVPGRGRPRSTRPKLQ